MRFQVIAGALVVSLFASGLAPASTRTGNTARPDLVVSSLSNPPAVAFQGRGFAVTDRTRNIGGVTARATVARYYLSASGKRTAAGRRSVVPLRPQRSSRGSATVTAPATLQGTYSLVACADAGGAVRESSERNNCRTAATTVIVRKPPPPV